MHKSWILKRKQLFLEIIFTDLFIVNADFRQQQQKKKVATNIW